MVGGAFWALRGQAICCSVQFAEGLGVAGHLEVADAGDRPLTRSPRNCDRSLPVGHKGAALRVQLLIRERRLDRQVEATTGDLYPPTDRVSAAALRALPDLLRRELEGAQGQMLNASIGIDQAAARVRVRTTIRQAELIQHQLDAILKLDREPVPADLRCGQLAAPELVIHPG